MAMVFKSTRLMVEVEQIRGIHAWVYIPLSVSYRFGF